MIRLGLVRAFDFAKSHLVRRVRLNVRAFMLVYYNCKKIYACTSEQRVDNTVSSVLRGINALAKCSEPIKHIKHWGISIYSVNALSCFLLHIFKGVHLQN